MSVVTTYQGSPVLYTSSDGTVYRVTSSPSNGQIWYTGNTPRYYYTNSPSNPASPGQSALFSGLGGALGGAVGGVPGAVIGGAAGPALFELVTPGQQYTGGQLFTTAALGGLGAGVGQSFAGPLGAGLGGGLGGFFGGGLV